MGCFRVERTLMSVLYFACLIRLNLLLLGGYLLRLGKLLLWRDLRSRLLGKVAILRNGFARQDHGVVSRRGSEIRARAFTHRRGFGWRRLRKFSLRFGPILEIIVATAASSATAASAPAARPFSRVTLLAGSGFRFDGR